MNDPSHFGFAARPVCIDLTISIWRPHDSEKGLKNEIVRSDHKS
ncbi:hypothetical protein BIFPSEUDO_04333 [Bifidobacterium pseudocatenulatum DSM 20438 = JCM 1200 = LMG 10505]|uniref:Uncharacterized protein n=1 Tax=Bifidobacterium pseudocatenulatum DSM 20438 = JCM 1200 = LMG 10505 TaxID=547043 RepID=C0BV89_BIFPS|nr:hypothetical protein BIFPSEUDO_04333 [Bifidobacterium pseudocatenulatum DSM 20438 = JCM 1200 = LMG 10505]